MPSLLLPEMTLRASADAPPIVTKLAPETRMPFAFPSAAAPAAFVPIRLPVIW
jgi:hypothetical protein